jgi:hypothetical protein
MSVSESITINNAATSRPYCLQASDVIKTGSAETKAKTKTDCNAQAQDRRIETSRAATGRDQEYVVQGRTDQILTYIQKIQNLGIKIMHGIIASSQRTVDGTPREEFNQKLRTSDQQNKNNSWTYCVTLSKHPARTLITLIQAAKLTVANLHLESELCGNRK